MDNVSKAMQMVGGVLIGVILLALVSYFFSSIGAWPAEEDDIESAEQTAAFNLEYEVYDKKGMYGVDVISCLNKAKSNNEKYVEGGSFLTGTKYGNEYTVDVYVNFTGELEESLTIYYYDYSGKQREYFGDTKTGKYFGDDDAHPNSSITMAEAGFTFKDTFITNFYESMTLTRIPGETVTTETATYEYDGKKYCSLMKGSMLSDLISMELTYTVTNTDSDLTSWSKAVWSTALTGLKNKKFKCDYIGYNTDTGRVNEIYFSEI